MSCNGIMDYGDSADEWSECSKDDFRAQYALQIRTQGHHCMKGNEFPNCAFAKRASQLS